MSHNPIPIIVIEDDEDDYLEIETRLLEAGEDLDLQRCTRLNDALALLERQMQFDLVLVDLSLPGLVDNAAGYAYEVIRQRLPNAKIIVLTGNQDPRLAKQIKESGGEFLVKGDALCGDSKTLMIRFLKFLITQQIQASSQQKLMKILRTEFAELKQQWQLMKSEINLLERRSLYLETAIAGIKESLKNFRNQISVNENNAKLALETIVQLKQQPQPTLTVFQLAGLITFAVAMSTGSAIAVYLLVRNF